MPSMHVVMRQESGGKEAAACSCGMQLLVSSSSPVQMHVGACLVLAVGACPLLYRA